MFIEPNFGNRHESRKSGTGWIEVVCGSMFSGKTEELIRRLRRAKIANQRVEIFKPQVDSRYHPKNVVSHDANMILSNVVTDSSQILREAIEVDVLGLDESQFLDEGIIEGDHPREGGPGRGGQARPGPHGDLHLSGGRRAVRCVLCVC